MTKTATCPPGALHFTGGPDPYGLEWVLWDRSMFRSRLATCMDCSPELILELGTIGGRLRIRRTDLAGVAASRVRVTPVSPHPQVEEWWRVLVPGG